MDWVLTPIGYPQVKRLFLKVKLHFQNITVVIGFLSWSVSRLDCGPAGRRLTPVLFI